MLRLLVVGSGAREHTLVWKLAQSPKVGRIYAAPGNAGTAQLAHNLNISPTDIEALARVAQAEKIDLTVVGPEAPLAEGIVDRFQSLGLPIFGPTRAATQLEASKVFARQLMEKYGIPCPRGAIFSNHQEARGYLQAQRPPIVVKADGLAAGKGVTVAASMEQALAALDDTMERHVFGDAGNRVIIDECLTGLEASLLAVTDGHTVIEMAPACDYKRVFDDDQGPNTGGMGGYSPPGFLPESLVRRIKETILEPAVKAMAQEGIPYKGVLYGGLMLTPDGPKVLEFNARFGDPETQVMLPRLRSDLLDILLATVEGRLHEINIEWSPDACVGVVMASAGYPGGYQKGFPITGWEDLDEDVQVFHAGTKLAQDGQIVTDGGRVLTVVATGQDIATARAKVYANLPRLHFQGAHYRRDIALRELASNSQKDGSQCP
ncbi:MAG TPA: phosphoribosylamine--glycine ligase [Dehalococcoidia bacterium]|nr:phosphoribosylamine--glycine ligase [Dehalococcoidia bacterium]